MLRVLVVGGDPTQRQALRRALDAQGSFELVEVGNAADARGRARALERSIARSSTRTCPHRAASRSSEKLRADGIATPIIFVGGNDEEALQQARRCGRDRFHAARRSVASPARAAHALRDPQRRERSRQDAGADRGRARARRGARRRLARPARAAARDQPRVGGTARRGRARQQALSRCDRSRDRPRRAPDLRLLDATAVENGALALSRASVNINSIVRQAAADYELAAKESGRLGESDASPTIRSSCRPIASACCRCCRT